MLLRRSVAATLVALCLRPLLPAGLLEILLEAIPGAAPASRLAPILGACGTVGSSSGCCCRCSHNGRRSTALTLTPWEPAFWRCPTAASCCRIWWAIAAPQRRWRHGCCCWSGATVASRCGGSSERSAALPRGVRLWPRSGPCREGRLRAAVGHGGVRLEADLQTFLPCAAALRERQLPIVQWHDPCWLCEGLRGNVACTEGGARPKQPGRFALRLECASRSRALPLLPVCRRGAPLATRRGRHAAERRDGARHRWPGASCDDAHGLRKGLVRGLATGAFAQRAGAAAVDTRGGPWQVSGRRDGRRPQRRLLRKLGSEWPATLLG
mmetsp:Transcript_143397/g.373698  ORF Transcript_143397/g.373698 Transcript_143397/m.373698 type:complete len:325 (-) Transcript_143397:128-1102(-)